MSGGLFVSALLRETGRSLSKADIDLLQQAHAEQYRAQLDSVTPLPGARELLGFLTDAGVPWAIATSGYAATARPALGLLGLAEDTPMVTRDLVRHAKPDPDLFLAAPRAGPTRCRRRPRRAWAPRRARPPRPGTGRGPVWRAAPGRG